MKPLSVFLTGCHWVAKLTPEQQARVQAETTTRFYPAGSFVCRRQERLEHWIGVLEGTSILICDTAEGKPSVFVVLSEGSWFGEGSLLKNEPLKFEAFAKTDCHIAFLPRPTFMWLYETSIGFNNALVDQLNQRCGQLFSIMTSDRGGRIEERVAQCMMTLINPVLYPGTGQRIQISQEEIGYLSGLSRQMVNKALKTLEQAGLIKVEFRHITVVDVDRLLNFTADSLK
jgi:CRP/FNR family cyclic AMP-dependent transcriptional regulator